MPPETPERLVESMRGDDGDAARLRRLVADFAPDRIREALRGRVGVLWGRSEDVLLQLLAAFGDDAHFAELAEAIEDGPPPAAERAWEVLTLLDERGHLEAHPALAEWLEELNEAIESDDAASDELAEAIESDPDGVWLALQGLDAVEPEIRPALVSELASPTAGLGVVEFLRLLVHAHDGATREAAIEALRSIPPALAARAWERLVEEHDDPEIVALARRHGEGHTAGTVERTAPRLLHCVVTRPNAAGHGYVVLTADSRGEEVTAAYGIDAMAGVVEVVGQIGGAAGESLTEEIVEQAGREVVEGDAGLALGLLAGALTLSNATTPLALRYWLERTAGPRLTAQPFAEPAVPGPSLDPGSAARRVLDACPWWVDDSDLVYELAEELALRERAKPDAGVFRYLFEASLAARLERDRRLLLWMGAFWTAQGRAELAAAALSLAEPLLDPQNAVPGHPFITELARRSLARARDDLARGIDLRDPDVRHGHIRRG